MGIVAEFIESEDLGWDITRSEFLAKVLEELPEYPGIILVITGKSTVLLKRAYLKVKVVNPIANGNPTGDAE